MKAKKPIYIYEHQGDNIYRKVETKTWDYSQSKYRFNPANRTMVEIKN